MENYVQQLTRGQQAVLAASQRHQDGVIKQYLANSPPEPTEFESGDYVLVSYPTRPPSKLHGKWRGPYAVVEKTNNQYKCQDLCSNRVLEFDVTRLKKWTTDVSVDNMQVAASDDGKYLVEAIIDHRGNRRRKSALRFRVRWLGY